MEVNKTAPISKIQGPSPATNKSVGKGEESSFADALKQTLKQNVDEKKEGAEIGVKESEKLAEQKARKPIEITFSNHAVERMRSRGISYSPDELARIDEAMNKASEKGAKETLILHDDSALILNVKDKKIVTVMDKASIRDNVFTKIDSTVLL